MQVPAYWPVEEGIQCVEYKGVLIEVKNTMAMEEASMVDMEDESMPDMEEAEAGEADVVEAMEGMAVDMAMPDMEDMLISLVEYRGRFNDLSMLDYGGSFAGFGFVLVMS